MAQVILRTHDLTKRYGGFVALDKVSLTLNEGDIYGLVGRNGAGKTTLFKCVMGLAHPTDGTIVVSDETVRLNRARKKMGFMINASFFPYLGPKENLGYLCRIKGFRQKGEVDRLLELVGLSGVKKPFKAFSLGMKQRLGIAGALLGSPSVVVLDEPINGLDPQGIIDMRNVIKDVHEQTNTTFMISSHILSELDMVATKFGFIDHGVLLQEIAHADLHKHARKSLAIEVDQAAQAKVVLEALGIRDVSIEGNRLILSSHLDRSSEIARALVNNNVALHDLHRQETTLEDYFMRLIGGGQDV